MSYPTISKGLPSAISSLELVCGVTPCAALDGRMTVPCGPDPALASLSARQAKEAGLLTSGTFGRHGITSSASAVLSLSLANRLRARTDLLGSTLYTLTWKERVTPSGRTIFALRASGRRTSDSGCTSWLTPKLPSGGTCPRNTPGGGLRKLEDVADLATWPTPNAMTGGQTSRGGSRKDELLMGGLAQLTASGPTPTGSPAATEKRGQLNPALSRWLMGLPKEWDIAAIMAYRSMRTKQQKPE